MNCPERLKSAQGLIATVPDAIYFKDANLRFQRVNHGAVTLAGALGAEALVGRSLSEPWPGNEGAAAAEEAERALLRERRQSRDHLATFSVAGERRWFSSSKAPIYGQSGTPVGLVGIARDVTDRVRMEEAPAGVTISELLERGEIDGFIAPRVPSLAGKNNPQIGWLFADPIAAGRDYFKRTGFFPIMHVTGIRRELVEANPWLPAAVFKAFQQAKTQCLAALEDTAASKVTLPFVEEQLRSARELMGHDFWSYGLGPNRKELQTFLRHHHAQGLSSRLVAPAGSLATMSKRVWESQSGAVIW